MSINASLIGQMITFAIFVWFCMKFIWPRLMDAIKQRQKMIADGLAAADKGQRELEAAEKKMLEIIDDGKQKAAQIVQQAQSRGQQIIEEAKAKAQVEQARIVAQAESDIEQSTNAARQSLYQEIGHLAVLGAEKVIGRNMADNDEEKLIDELLAEIK